MQIRTTRNTVAAAAIFLALSGVSAIGTANIPELSIDSVRVSYADLNLNKIEDAQTLYTRLRRTAENVCQDMHRNSLQDMVNDRECKERALDRAVSEIGHENLVGLHQG